MANRPTAARTAGTISGALAIALAIAATAQTPAPAPPPRPVPEPAVPRAVAPAPAAPPPVAEEGAAPTPEATGEPAATDPITAATWGRRVGFAPDLTGAPEPGITIDDENLATWKAWVPEGVAVLVERYALELSVVAYEPVHPSTGYIAATNRYRGQARLIPGVEDPRKQGIEGYTAGLPFPQPTTGREIAYDYALAYRGDDGTYHYGVFWISAKRGVERWEEWRWEFIRRVQWRTDIEPIPAFEDLAEEGVAGLSVTYAESPQDKRGFASLYKGMEDPEDIRAWIYLPPTRRILQMTIGTRGDAWNSTDMLYEDVGGYAGHPEWMTWTLVEKKTVLAPVHSALPTGKKALDRAFDFETWPHWNLRAKWEPRPVYVVDATPRLADYPYSRMRLFVDAETFHILTKVAWDKKGKLWKVLIHATNASEDMDERPLRAGTALVVDLQAEHATAFPAYGYEANVGHHPDDFTISRLKKMGR